MKLAIKNFLLTAALLGSTSFFASDVMGNGLSEANVNNHCIGNCYGEQRLSLESNLAQLRRLVSLVKEATEFNSKNIRSSNIMFESIKKNLKCIHRNTSMDAKPGLYYTDNRLADVKFSVLSEEFRRTNSQNENRIASKSSIVMDHIKFTQDRTINWSSTKYLVNNQGEVLRIDILKNKVTKEVVGYNYTISQCESNAWNKNVGSLYFGNSDHNSVYHFNIWDRDQVSIRFEGINGIGVHEFDEPSELLLTAMNRLDGLSRDMKYEMNNKIFVQLIGNKLHGLKRHLGDPSEVETQIYEIFNILLIKYQNDGLSKAEVINRALKLFPANRKNQDLYELIDKVF